MMDHGSGDFRQAAVNAGHRYLSRVPAVRTAQHYLSGARSAARAVQRNPSRVGQMAAVLAAGATHPGVNGFARSAHGSDLAGRDPEHLEFGRVGSRRAEWEPYRLREKLSRITGAIMSGGYQPGEELTPGGISGYFAHNDEQAPSKAQARAHAPGPRAAEGHVGIEVNPGPKQRAQAPPRRSARIAARAAAKAGGTTPLALAPTNMSAVYREDFGNRTQGGTTMRARVPLGYLNLTGADESGSVYVPGSVIYSILMDRNLFLGTELQGPFDSFERWKMLSAKLDYLPSVSTATAGSLYFWSDPDAQDALAPPCPVSSAVIMSHRGCKQTVFAGFKGMALNVSRALLWSDPAMSEGSTLSGSSAPAQAASSGDSRFDAAGILSVACGDGLLVAGSAALGELFLDCVVHFSVPQRSEIGALVFNARAVAQSGTGMINLTTATTIGVLENIFEPIVTESGLLGGDLAASEYMFNPRFCQPSANSFSLPVGYYIFIINLFANGSATSATFPTTLANGIWSTDAIICTTGSAAETLIEFAGTPVNANNPSGDAAYFMVRTLRVTSTSGPNACMSLAVSFRPVFTGSSALTGYQMQMLRVPALDANPLGAYYPHGNNGGGIVLSARAQRLLDMLKLDEGKEQVPEWAHLLCLQLREEHWTETAIIAYAKRERFQYSVPVPSLSPADVLAWFKAHAPDPMLRQAIRAAVDMSEVKSSDPDPMPRVEEPPGSPFLAIVPERPPVAASSGPVAAFWRSALSSQTRGSK